MLVPDHHKSIAKHLKTKFGEPATVYVFRDNQGKKPVPFGEFGIGKNRFISTIGISDNSYQIPKGHYEFAAKGELLWLPNAVASSIYWLKNRIADDWPLVCEDVVKQNAKSTYRHMVYVPSQYTFQAATGPVIRWLLGAPITDSEISLDFDEASQKIRKLYPSWFFEPGA
jgi:hypothetical protein